MCVAPQRARFAANAVEKRVNQLKETMTWMQSNAVTMKSSSDGQLTPMEQIQRIAQQQGLSVASQQNAEQIQLVVSHANYVVLANFLTQLTQNGLSIEKGVLKIDLNYWYSCGSWYTNHNTYIFRYQNNQFEMIGYESSEFHRASGEATSISINYSTKKKIETTGLNEFNESKPKSKVSKIKINKLYNLNEIVMDYNFPNE